MSCAEVGYKGASRGVGWGNNGGGRRGGDGGLRYCESEAKDESAPRFELMPNVACFSFGDEGSISIKLRTGI